MQQQTRNSTLYTPEITYLRVHSLNPLTITFSAHVEGSANITMRKDRDVTALLSITDLTNITLTVSPAFESKISFDNGSITDGHPPYRNVTLTYYYEHPDPTDSGIYSCELGAHTATFHIVVVGDSMLYTPEFTELNVHYLNPLTVTCSAYITGSANITMLKDGNVAARLSITDLTNITLTTSPGFEAKISFVSGSIAYANAPYRNVTLTYYSAQPKKADIGFYGCQLGYYTAWINVRFLGPPLNITIKIEGVDVTKLLSHDMPENSLVQTAYEAALNKWSSGSVKLTATAIGYSDSLVSWYQKEVDSSNWIETNQTSSILLQLSPSMQENVTLLASAVNEFGSYNVTIYINVGHYPASFSEFISYPTEGRRFSRGCHFYAVPPAIVTYEKLNIETLEWESANSVNGTLYIASVNLERDVGTYRCIGTNIHGSTSVKFGLSGEPWTARVMILKVYSTSVNLLLEVGCATQVSYNLTATTFDDENHTVIRNLMGETANSNRYFKNHSLQLDQLQPKSLYSLNGYIMNAFGSIQFDPKNFTTEAEHLWNSPPGLTGPTKASKEDSMAKVHHSVSSTTDVQNNQGQVTRVVSPSFFLSCALLALTSTSVVTY